MNQIKSLAHFYFKQTFPDLSDQYLTKQNLIGLEEELLKTYCIQYLTNDPAQNKTKLAINTLYLYEIFHSDELKERKVIAAQYHIIEECI